MKALALIPALLLAAACNPAPDRAAAPGPAPEPAPVQMAKPAPTPEEQAAQRQVQMELCKGYAKMARTIMEIRQDGAPMDGAMEVVKGSAQAQQLLISAYEVPQYSSDRYKEREVQKFGNETYLACVKEIPAG